MSDTTVNNVTTEEKETTEVMSEKAEFVPSIDLTGQVFRVFYSKKKPGKLVSFTPSGKVMIITNREKVHNGYAKVTSCTEKENFFFVEMENVRHDYYPGINLEELELLLNEMGFTRQYSEAIDDANSFIVWAKIDTGEMVTIDTWNVEGEKPSFNSIEVYVPTGNNTFMKAGYRHGIDDGFSNGNFNVCCYNLVHSTIDNPMHYYMSLSSGSCDWKGATPSLWTRKDFVDGEVNFADALVKLKKFKDNVIEKFNMDVEGQLENMAKFNITPSEK